MEATFHLQLPGRPVDVPVLVGEDVSPSDLEGFCPPPNSGGLVLADKAVAERHGARLAAIGRALLQSDATPLLLEAGEATKEASELPRLWAAMAARGLDRRARLVVVGGGSLLDLGAFLGGTYLRGIETVLVPTTLLAQVDSTLGGKCGVNLGEAKNQVGLILQPRAIIADTHFLRTLPAGELASGQGEVLKTALLAGGQLWEAVQAEPTPASLRPIVQACLQFKADIVRQDEREGGVRRALNLGHTLGHVFESLALMRRTPVPHGIAVGLGLAAEQCFWGWSSNRAVDGLHGLLEAHGIALSARSQWAAPREVLLDLLGHDKKREGREVIVPTLQAPGQFGETRLGLPQLLEAYEAFVGA